MSLDVYLRDVVYNDNITHNLVPMAAKAGLYYALWRPEEIGIETASDLIPSLEAGLKYLKDHPDEARQYNSPNGFGKYEDLVSFVEGYLEACRERPLAYASAWR